MDYTQLVVTGMMHTKWTNGVPGPNSDVVITAKGNYSVGLQGDVTIKSLTIGNSAPGEHKH